MCRAIFDFQATNAQILGLRLHQGRGEVAMRLEQVAILMYVANTSRHCQFIAIYSKCRPSSN